MPKDVENVVKQRDITCVYCGAAFTDSTKSRKTIPTWEHIINDISLCGADNIALCCCSCNASKGAKLLVDWLDSKYCKQKGITKHTVSDIVKSHLT